MYTKHFLNVHTRTTLTVSGPSGVGQSFALCYCEVRQSKLAHLYLLGAVYTVLFNNFTLIQTFQKACGDRWPRDVPKRCPADGLLLSTMTSSVSLLLLELLKMTL